MLLYNLLQAHCLQTFPYQTAPSHIQARKKKPGYSSSATDLDGFNQILSLSLLMHFPPSSSVSLQITSFGEQELCPPCAIAYMPQHCCTSRVTVYHIINSSQVQVPSLIFATHFKATDPTQPSNIQEVEKMILRLLGQTKPKQISLL